MYNITSWFDKYQIAMKEYLTLRDIMLLRDCGQPKAIAIRDAAREYALMNNIYMERTQVPTEAVMSVTGKQLDYYYEKMCKEYEAFSMKRSIGA